MSESRGRKVDRLEQAKEELICPICTDFFNRPRCLHCLHSFCENCLTQLQRASEDPNVLTCPECRAKSELPANGIVGLRLNFKLARFVEILTPEEKDQLRKISHYRRYATQHCKSHTEKSLEYYCNNCRELVCGQCMLDEHRLHDVVYAENILPQHVESLRSFLPLASKSAVKARSVLSAFKEEAETVRKQGENTVKSIRGYFSKIRQVLAEREEQLVDSVQKETSTKVGIITTKESSVLEALDSIQRCSQSLREISERRAADLAVLLEEDTLKATLLTHVEAVETESRLKDQKDLPSLTTYFQQDPLFEQLCRTVGSEDVLPRQLKLNRSYMYQSPSSSPQQQRTESTVSTSNVIYAEPPKRQWDEKTISGTTNSSSDECIAPPTPPLRRESHSTAIQEPVLEIGPKSLSGSLFRHRTEEVFPCGVAAGGNNTIIVADVRNHCLRILAATGRCLEIVGSEGKGDGQFFEPTAVATDSEGNILISDKDPPRIQKFSGAGKFLSKFSTRSLRGLYLGEPWGIAVSYDKKVLVTDWDKSCIHIYDQNGKYQGNFGPTRIDPPLKYPAGIAVDKRGRIVVADRGNHCIWIYTPDGQLLSRFGRQGHGPGDLYYPFGIAIDKDANIIISESGNHRISVFTAAGKFVRCFGKKGKEPGMFQYPRHICIDNQGQLIVADELNQRLQVFANFA